jgi:ligand-binding sensor domain-containing protein
MAIKLATLLLITLSAITVCNGQPNKLAGDIAMMIVAKGDTVQELGSSIMVIYQDAKSVYWFGSWETGLYKYDGKTIIHYTTKHGLPHNRIDEIKEDKFGNIYLNGCYPFSAITKFNGKTFIPVPMIKSKEWKLQTNDLWFKHPFETGEVYRFDGNVFHELQLPKHPKFPNPYEVYSIYKDSKGSIWFGTNPVGVCRYNGQSFDWISESDVTELHGGPANGVRSIAEDRNGYFWFNTEFHYDVYDSIMSGSKQFYKREKSIGSLDGKKDGNLNEYLSIVKDNDGNLWIATYRNGVWKYDGTKTIHYPIKVDTKDITIFSIYKDNNGTLWLGTHENGVLRFNGENFEQFNTIPRK